MEIRKGKGHTKHKGRGKTATNIKIIVSNMPATVHGTASASKDGFVVMVNANDDRQRQYAAICHELEHIWMGDFDANKTADEIEMARHRKDVEL